jgi:hypothetical protein
MKQGCSGLAGLFSVLALAAPAAGQTTTLPASADTYLRSGSANQNQGTESILRIQMSGNNRALVRFEQGAIAQTVGTGTLVSATLRLFIEHNGNNWGANGSTVSAHRITANWTETGATWNCGIDGNPANGAPDCGPQWGGGQFQSSATSSLLHTSGLTGWVQFDVTPDVSAFLAGTEANFGWLVKKANEIQSGLAEYTSREGTAVQRPQLVLVVESATADEVAPAVRITSPSLPVLVNVPAPQITVAYSDNGTGVDLATLRVLVDSTDITAGCTTGPASASCTPGPLSAGTHVIQASISDVAGNPGSASYSFDLFLGNGPHALSVEAVADTYLREGAPNQNQGGLAFLRIRDSGNNRALVRFDGAQVSALVAGHTLLGARLEVFIQDNGGNWTPSGGTVDVHRVDTDWTEAGATWNCPADAELANFQANCPSPWNGGSFAAAPTASALHANGTIGWVQWNVTADVAALLSGTPHLGWLIKKTNEGQSGLADYSSREGAAGQRPRLVLTVLPGDETVISITGVSEGHITNQDLLIEYTATGNVASLTGSLRRGGEAEVAFASGTTVSEEGVYLLVVTASDPSGNLTTRTRSFVIDKTPPVIHALADPPANVNGWHRTDVVVTFSCTDDGSGIAACPEPRTVVTEGASQAVTGTVADLAGNTALTTLSLNLDKTPPNVVATSFPPPNGRGWNNTEVTVSVVAQDDLSGVDNVSPPVAVAGEVEGGLVQGAAVDRAGNAATVTTFINIDRTPPVITIESPTPGELRRVPRVTVTGSIADAHEIVGIRLNEVALPPGPTFTGEAALQPGNQPVVVAAEDVAGNTGTATVSVLHQRLPTLQITSPANLAAFGSTPITVSGVVDDPAAVVTVGVERVPAVVNGDTFTASGVSLKEGGNVVTAVATNAEGGSSSDSVTLVLDTVAPRVFIDSPAAGSLTTEATLTVTGRINDVVMGTINSGQAHVVVNGVTADVANRTFVARGIPLQPGENSVTATAIDAVGNSDSKSIVVFRESLPGSRLSVVSGNEQTAGIGEPAPASLVVAVTDTAGVPIPDLKLVLLV